MQVTERPTQPDNALVVTACCMHNSRESQNIALLSPSARGELEITDVNIAYIAERPAAYDILPGWWIDADTRAGRLKASILVALSKVVTFQA